MTPAGHGSSPGGTRSRDSASGWRRPGSTAIPFCRSSAGPKRPGTTSAGSSRRSDRRIRPDVIDQVTIEAKYNGYIGRQVEQIERFRRLEDKPIPDDLDYRAIPQLRAEAREKFQRIRPLSLGQAGRISGISPADIATLLVHLKKQQPHDVDSKCFGASGRRQSAAHAPATVEIAQMLSIRTSFGPEFPRPGRAAESPRTCSISRNLR